MARALRGRRRDVYCAVLLLLAACLAPDHASSPTVDLGAVSPGAVGDDGALPRGGGVPVVLGGPPPPSSPWGPGLRINELMARNDSTVMDTDLGFPDWIELHNASDVAIALDRVVVRTDADTWVGSAGEIEPGGVALLLGAVRLEAEGDHLDVLLDGEIVDSVATGRMAGDVTWARYPDGGQWAYSAKATPGWTNGSAPGASADPSTAIFQTDAVTDVWIGLSAAAITHLDGDPYTEVDGTFAFEGAYFPHVNVRRKGVYGSLRGMSQKAALKIDFGDGGESLRGLEHLTLNNMVQDPTYVHEALTYLLYRACDLPAPRVGFTRMYVNDQLYGLYVNVETIDEVMLGRWFADPYGDLYEGAYGVDFYDGYEAYFECDRCADPTDRSAITAVTEVLDGAATDAAYAELSTLVDMDQLLRYMAVEAAVWHWDGYTTSNNYRVYLDPRTGRFSMVPWGTDQTWVDEWYGPFDARGRIFAWCLQNDGCEADYLDRLDEVADVVDSLTLADTMATWLALLDADIRSDPRREWTDGTRNAYLRATRDTISTTADRIRAAADSRR